MKALRNKHNGKVTPWSEIKSKMDHLEEIEWDQKNQCVVTPESRGTATKKKAAPKKKAATKKSEGFPQAETKYEGNTTNVVDISALD